MTDAFATFQYDNPDDAGDAVEALPESCYINMEAFVTGCKQKFLLVTFGDDEAEISVYSMSEQTGAASIDSEAATIDIEVEFETNVTALVATFTASTDRQSITVGGVAQVSATTENDFTDPVVYRVIAENGTIKDWTVTVTVAAE